MWYCVIRLHDYRIVYHGTNEQAAAAAKVDGTHLVAASDLGRSQKRAALEAGYLNRGKPLPPRD